MIGEHDAGKGPTSRKVNCARYRYNFDEINWNKEPDELWRGRILASWEGVEVVVEVCFPIP